MDTESRRSDNSVPREGSKLAAVVGMLRQSEGATIRDLTADDVNIRVMGDFAIIHGATSYTTPDGKEAHGRYTDCWARQHGKWLAVSAHVSR